MAQSQAGHREARQAWVFPAPHQEFFVTLAGPVATLSLLPALQPDAYGWPHEVASDSPDATTAQHIRPASVGKMEGQIFF